jgi:branched-chain amino acid transport system ATP-binding protein
MSDHSGLTVNGVTVFYGQHQALNQVSLTVKPGEIVVILGANGAGKSTLLQTISGLVPRAGGTVSMHGHALGNARAHHIVEAGLALVPEGRGIFGDLSVEENLTLGAYSKRAREREQQLLDTVYQLFPKLVERRKQIARTMSGGEQQMVAIGRAMMSAPDVLMLDEPSLGLSPLLASEVFKTLKSVRDTGLGILLVEQNAKQSLSIADRGYLLENGAITAEDSAKNLLSDPAVVQAYLGGAASSESPSTHHKKGTPSSGHESVKTVEQQIAEQALASFRTADLDKRQPAPTRSLAGGDIQDWIQQATARQRSTWLTGQLGQSSRAEAGSTAGQSSLNDMLSQFEQAARASTRSTAGPVETKPAAIPKVDVMHEASVIQDDPDLPTIEVFKRTEVEPGRFRMTPVNKNKG